MPETQQLRSDLVELLKGGSAHLTWQQAFDGLRPEYRAAPPAPELHTIWQLLEHMRLAQEDILRYTLEAGWRSPKWPDGYWPAVTEPTEAQWRGSLAGFERDLGQLIALVRDPARDLTARIPHGGDHTYLREVLLVADHNGHHLGQVVTARRLLGDWRA